MVTGAVTLAPRQGSRRLRLFSTALSSTALSSLFPPSKHKRTEQQELKPIFPKPDDIKPQQSFYAPLPSTLLAAQRQSLLDPNADPPKRLSHPLLYIYGLNKCTTTDGLRAAFSKFGKVVHAKIIRDQFLQNSRGFGYVKYATTEEAAKGLKGMDEQFLDGWVIFAEYARRRGRRERPKKNTVKLPQNNAKLPNQHSVEEKEKTMRRLATYNRLKAAKHKLRTEKEKMLSAKQPRTNAKRQISI